ncbi:MAG: hypothetical protein MHM6MM_001064 [Cercozoa sp. M6MM]
MALGVDVSPGLDYTSPIQQAFKEWQTRLSQLLLTVELSQRSQSALQLLALHAQPEQVRLQDRYSGAPHSLTLAIRVPPHLGLLGQLPHYHASTVMQEFFFAAQASIATPVLSSMFELRDRVAIVQLHCK